MLQLPFEQIIIALAAVLGGLTIHELAHAWVALLLGDDTAARDGRITLNPIRHIDPWGFLLLIVAGFGWAKPVMIDRTKLRHPRRDDTLIALAGPAVNLAAGFFCVIFLRFADGAGIPLLSTGLYVVAWMNVALGVFNLLPIPPLDGSHVILNLLPPQSVTLGNAFFRYGTFALIGIVLLESVMHVDILPLGPMIRGVLGFFVDIAAFF